MIDQTKTTTGDRWDRHFLQLCQDHARMSKDPRTRVGAIIVGPDREIRSAGFNGFPRGIADTAERLNDRDMKLRLVVHGEMNAVLAAARTGTPLKGCTLYLAATDDTGEVWGGVPCTRCTVEVIQAGITEIVSFTPKAVPSKWHDDLALARTILAEAGITYRQIEA
jgi:dCMP deaminase